MSSVVSPSAFIPLLEPTLEGNAKHYVLDALDSGWVSSAGPYVDQFEQEMARYLGIPRAVATVNGTAALHVALLLAGVQPGDEVIVPSLTFIASVNVIRYVQATPVFWDSAQSHWNADESLLETLITPKTKAIIVVHLYGVPVNMDAVLAVAKRHGLKVIEDAAEALGASWNDQPCGTMGDIGCLSFNGNKTLTTGGGGMLLSRDEALMEKAHYLINQAKDDTVRFVHHEVGYNYRLTNLLAALGLSQLELLPQFLAQKQDIIERYQQAFSQNPAIQTIASHSGGKSANWLYALALNSQLGKSAMDLVEALQSKNIQARPFFMPAHLQTPYKPFQKAPLPHAESWNHYGLNLPTSSHLSPEQQERVIAAVLETVDGWCKES